MKTRMVVVALLVVRVVLFMAGFLAPKETSAASVHPSGWS